MSAQPVPTTAEPKAVPLPASDAEAVSPGPAASAATPRRVALVTGANRGIGLEICRQLAAEGVRVLLSGRSAPAVTEAARRLASEGLDVEAVVLDVTDPRSIQAAADGIGHRHGRLDILVNNAAIRVEPYGCGPSAQPLALWHQTFATNLFGVVAVTQAMLPLLRRSPAARIVNVSSLLASLGTHSDPASYAYSDMFKSLPAYSASKSAVNAWTVHLAYELRETGIKVNAVHPGYTRTDMNEGAGELEPGQGALTSVRMALLGPDGPTGQYVHMGRQIPW
ncbi:SDR family oxidoreductase [Roseateles depolymerans]|uniref:2-hydroxycyclohexanecarboxyl-CoA dehydrogenase n=1 Tax=Roseateles depolymerans TaxID=76731 RepID=A0A0U3MIH3_9BURK|nr:SDR family oxidoreductase [Roseateles depolymerans]ALV07356.1 2-hydroxycyclohexanecarboxyl-CoA dehydrogenase [Roseateles depolymerans]REG22434.1 NAD(P)-dependent dehydrogenase (short-subunit alcohol dehydrogenase family) [Roseateles depolymerans]